MMRLVAGVLIVEDQPELARLIAAAVEDAGFEAGIASRARDAIERLDRDRPDAILLDLLLPDALGFEVARQARQRLPEAAVVALSGVFREDPAVRDALRTGVFDAFFEKPFRIRDVLERLRTLLPAGVADAAAAPAGRDPALELQRAVVEGTTQDYLFDPPEAGLEAALRASVEGTARAVPEIQDTTAGDLAEQSVPRLINAFYLSGESGELHLQRGKVRKVVYFHEGLPAFATSNLRRDRFDELLIRRGTVDAAAIRSTAERAARAGSRIDRVLVQEGLLTPARQRQLVAEQVKEILFSLFSWREGRWRMTFQRRAEEEPIRLGIFPAELILEGVHTLSIDKLSQGLGPELRLAPAPSPPYELYQLSLTGPQALVVSRLDGNRTVADLAEEGWLPERETWALLYGLLSLEVVEDASLLLL